MLTCPQEGGAKDGALKFISSWASLKALQNIFSVNSTSSTELAYDPHLGVSFRQHLAGPFTMI